jgi:type I restriction enzyme S subunit
MVKEYQSSGVKFLRSQNVREFRFDPTGIKFVSPEFHRLHMKSALHPGDVAVVRSGNAGAACVIPDGLGEVNCADIVVVRPSEALDPHYACVYINSASSRSDIAARMVGIAQGHFNVGSMRVTPIPLPPLVEQREIVRRVEALFALADAVERRVAAATVSAERLTQAVLARAFRGEIVPTEAELARREGRAYEPAEALLRRISERRLDAGSAVTGATKSRPRRGAARSRMHRLL